ELTRWYQHRFHNVLSHRIVFCTVPWMPRFVQRPIAAITALIFFFVLKRERRAVVGNLRRISGKRGLALQWKVYRAFYSFCDFMVSYCYVPQATHAQLLSILGADERANAGGPAQSAACLAAGKAVIVWTALVGESEVTGRLLKVRKLSFHVARVV